MLMKRRGVHSGLVVKVAITLNLKCYIPFISLRILIKSVQKVTDSNKLLNLTLLLLQGEEGALSMTTRLRSVNSSKGIPVNYCSGFRSLSMASACEVDGLFLYHLGLFCSLNWL